MVTDPGEENVDNALDESRQTSSASKILMVISIVLCSSRLIVWAHSHFQLLAVSMPLAEGLLVAS